MFKVNNKDNRTTSMEYSNSDLSDVKTNEPISWQKLDI